MQVTRALLYSSTPHLQKETVRFLANVLNAASNESLTGEKCGTAESRFIELSFLDFKHLQLSGYSSTNLVTNHIGG